MRLPDVFCGQETRLKSRATGATAKAWGAGHDYDLEFGLADSTGSKAVEDVDIYEGMEVDEQRPRKKPKIDIERTRHQVLARTGYYGTGVNKSFKFNDFGGEAGAKTAAELWLKPHVDTWNEVVVIV